MFENLACVKSSVSMAIAQLEMGSNQKKNLFSLSTNHAQLLLSLFSTFLSTFLSFFILSSFYFSISLFSFFFFKSHSSSLSLSSYCSGCAASRQRAAVLTCASNTWASLLTRLRSVLREIPSTYTR